MFRDNTYTPKSRIVNLVFMNGGVGDHMASLVAVDYIIKMYPWIKPLVWMPNFLLDFARHVLPTDTRIGGFSQMQREYNKNRTTKTTAWDGNTSPMKIHCLDYAFLKLCDENPDISYKNYLQIRPDEISISEFELPSKYVIVTTGYTASVREFPANHINDIVTYANTKGYEIVFLGQTQTKTGSEHIIEGKFDEKIAFHKGMNLIDKTSLLQTAKIMGNAKAVIGVDNGLLHVAGCTNVAIIGGFTTVSPHLRMPVRFNTLGWNFFPIIPNESLGCKFCQVKTNFLYDHDYKNCLYKDNLCTTQMTAKKFIIELEKIL